MTLWTHCRPIIHAEKCDQQVWCVILLSYVTLLSGKTANCNFYTYVMEKHVCWSWTMLTRYNIFWTLALHASLPQVFCDTIALPDICCTEHLPCQRSLLATVLAILDKAGEESSVHSFTLFYVVIHVMALQPQGNLDQQVQSENSHFTLITEDDFNTLVFNNAC